jgi:hypothetical protein
MSDETGPAEGGLSAATLQLADEPGSVGELAREIVRLAKLADEAEERGDVFASQIAGLGGRIDAVRKPRRH